MYWYKCSFVICIEYDEFLNFINLPKRVFCPATPYWWEYKLVQPLLWALLSHLPNEPRDPASPVLGLFPTAILTVKPNSVYKGYLLSAALFLTAKPWKALKYLSIRD